MAYDPSYLEESSTWKPIVGTAAALVLGLVLLVAAWGKALDPAAFVEQIRLEGLDFFGQAAVVAHLAIVLEVALGAALILGIRRWWVLMPSLLLVIFFLFLTGRAYWRFEQGIITEAEICGCFGNLVTRTPSEAFWQDLLLLGLPMGLAFVGRSRGGSRPPRRRLALVMLITAAGLALSLSSPHLPLDDLATRLHPGVKVGELCAGSEENPARVCLDTLIPDLDSGRHWVVISGLDEESFLAALPGLNEAALAGSAGRLWVVTSAAPEAVASFSWLQAPAFEVREVPATLLRPLHRRLPRSFLVVDGEVVETRSGLPPAAI